MNMIEQGYSIYFDLSIRRVWDVRRFMGMRRRRIDRRAKEARDDKSKRLPLEGELARSD